MLPKKLSPSFSKKSKKKSAANSNIFWKRPEKRDNGENISPVVILDANNMSNLKKKVGWMIEIFTIWFWAHYATVVIHLFEGFQIKHNSAKTGSFLFLQNVEEEFFVRILDLP